MIKILEVFLTIYRKGKTLKIVKTDDGELTIEVPRDNDSTFQPMLVKKNERNISDVEELVIKLYSKGMSIGYIESIDKQGQLRMLFSNVFGVIN